MCGSATGADGQIAGVVALAPGDAPGALDLNKLFMPLLRHPPEQRAGLAKIVGYCRCRQYLDVEEGSFLARAVLRQGEEVRFASDSPLEGSGFELPVPVRQAKLTRSCR